MERMGNFRIPEAQAARRGCLHHPAGPDHQPLRRSEKMADRTNSIEHRDGGQVSELMPRGRTKLTIDIEAMRKMGMKELHDFRDVVHVIGGVLSGFTCQPRFGHEQHEHRLNVAGELLEDIAELMNGYEQAAVNVAKVATP